MSQIVPRLLTQLARWEQCKLTSYLDSDGTWHIGYGHGNANGFPPFVTPTTVLANEAEAMDILVGELAKFYCPQLDSLLSTLQFKPNDNEYSALLDIGYNRGMGRLKNSLTFAFLGAPTIAWYREWAAQAMVLSSPDRFSGCSPASKQALKDIGYDGTQQFAPLDMNAKGETRLGLTLRRIDDASLFLTR